MGRIYFKFKKSFLKEQGLTKEDVEKGLAILARELRKAFAPETIKTWEETKYIKGADTDVKKAFPSLEIESIEKAGVPVGYISGNYKKVSDNPSKWAWIPKEKLKKEIYDFARKHYQGKQYYNNDLKANITVVRSCFDEWVSKAKSKEQTLALMKLPEMIKNAVKTGSAEDKYKNQKVFEVAYMRSKIKSNDKNCVAIMTVKRYVDKKNNLYHFYLDDIDFK